MTSDDHATLTDTLLEMEEYLALLRALGLHDLRTKMGYALAAGAERVTRKIHESQAILRRPDILDALEQRLQALEQRQTP